MMKRLAMLLLMIVLLPTTLHAQMDLAAVLEVITEQVEVKRINTDQWIPVRVEAIVGVGDAIRTGETGEARITFFADGVETIIEPNTLYQIDAFNGDEETFEISVSVLVGQTQQRLSKALDAGSSYDVTTPGTNLVARGTVFAIRVEDGGRSAMLVQEGAVTAENENSAADVPPEFGIRAEVAGALSDVVRASTFAELDAALDGCTINVPIPGDVRFNVRVGPSLEFPAVGTTAPEDIALAKGINEGGGWYRIDFRNGFGWFQSADVIIEGECAGLREFPDDHGPEDVTLYEYLGDPINLDDLLPPVPVEELEAGTSQDSEN